MRRRVLSLVLAVGVVAASASCSGSAPSATSGPAQTSGASSPAPAGGAESLPPAQASAAPPAAAGDVPQACELLSEDDIVELTTWKVAEATPETTHGVFTNGCNWTLAGGSFAGVPAQIGLGVMATGGRSYFDKYFAPFAAENGDEPLEGVGDVGLRGVADTVMAAQGDVLASVQWLDGLDADPTTGVEILRRVLENAAASD